MHQAVLGHSASLPVSLLLRPTEQTTGLGSPEWPAVISGSTNEVVQVIMLADLRCLLAEHMHTSPGVPRHSKSLLQSLPGGQAHNN